MKKESKIGIWGLGVVGRSLVKYLSAHGYKSLFVYDNSKNLNSEGLQVIDDLQFFLQTCDFIFPSPGIDLSSYQEYKSKFISEVDFFYRNWQKPIIVVTGTLGKTTLVTLLNSVLSVAGVKSVAAGNIDPAMCDVLDSDYEQVVLELSSFQLELSENFSPDVAIFTNLYPNHLDRHKTEENYFRAKQNIFLHQTAEQSVIMPICFYKRVRALPIKSKVYFFSEREVVDIPDICTGVFFKRNSKVVFVDRQQELEVADLELFAGVDTFEANLIILAAIMYLKQLSLSKDFEFCSVEHRLEKFCIKGGVDFYNDSKSTVPQATLAAVQKVAGRPTILFLGGLGKGVDRSGMIAKLAGVVKEIICFGSETVDLYDNCVKNKIKSTKFSNLEDAVDHCFKIAEEGDQVLFSPSGSSFDLFKNYAERGRVFKQLITSHESRSGRA